MTPLFLVTLDVEEDMPRWEVEPEITVKNVAAIPRFQKLCDSYEIRPTYLVTYPMATIKESVAILSDVLATGRCEIGTHLHPWNTPPRPFGAELRPVRPNELPVHLMAEKLQTLTDTITATFNLRPTSFRAGRFGFSVDCLYELERLGYQVDSSVTAGFSWGFEGGVDYFDAPRHPYFPDRHHVCREGSSPVLEVPVSVGFSRHVSPFVERIYHNIPRRTRIRGVLSNEWTRLLDYYILSPSERQAWEMQRLIDTLVAQRIPVLNLFFHSSELFPATSIYSQSTADVNRYFDRLEAVFDYTRRRGFRSVTLTESKSALQSTA